MRCVIVGESVKIFAKAIHCLAKIGDEIYVEPLKKGLSLRTVSSSRSAYACFVFMKNFFQSYDHGITDDQDAEGLKCKLTVKSVLTVFKSLSTIERIVDRCLMRLNHDEEQLTFLLYCRHGITKTYNLSYIDCESLQAVFTKELSPNLINVQPRILSEVVVNFHNTQEEISLAVCPQNMKVCNYIDEDQDPERVISTKMVLAAEEFEKYQIGVDGEVIFCLKELKGILTFAESSGQNMDIHFDSGGKPIVFSLASNPTYEANFVLATLIDVPGTQSSQQTQRKAEKQTARQATSPARTRHEVRPEDEFGLEEDDGDWADDIIAVEEQLSQETRQENNKEKNPKEDFSGDLVKKYAEMPFGGSVSADSENSPGIAVRSGKYETKGRQDDMGLLDEDQSQDSIPGTPPSKKFKSMLFSAMSGNPGDKTTVAQNASVVLAADTDDESD